MPGRAFSAENAYRYGFNGKENDKDISEGGQDYGMRIYDVRLGRFLSVDPITSKYPHYTPYQFSGNNPISSVDIDGLEPEKVFNANENVKAPDESNKLKTSIESTISNPENDSRTINNALYAKDSYENAMTTISRARFFTYNASADNMQLFLNGNIDKKIEKLSFLQSYNTFAMADAKLNSYIQTEAMSAGSTLKYGQSITFQSKEWASSVSAPLLPNDLYYSSGTSFIAGKAVLTVSKSMTGEVSFQGTFFKTWIDTYDWHKGLGSTSGGYIGGIMEDDDMENLGNFGAKGFELRTYYTTTVRIGQKIGVNNSPPYGTTVSTGIIYDTNQTEKTSNHPDKATTNGHQ